MAKKLKSLAKVVDEVAVLLQKLVRLKAADENGMVKCSTCHKVKHWKDMQGGHFISRKYTAAKIREENINPQCRGCNLFGMKHDSTVVLDYQDYMINMYGIETVEEMRALKHVPTKHNRLDLEDKKKEYKKLIAEMEREL